MKSGHKVCIGMVNDGTIDSLLALDLIHIARSPQTQFDHMIQVGNVGLTTRSRNVVVKTFLETTTSDWLLMVDSDERLTVDTFKKLIDTAHDKERPIVSGLVFAAFFDENEQLRPVPTIYKMDPEKGLEAIDDYPLDSVIEVDAVGTGCLLIHRDVLLKMQEEATENQGKDWAWFVEGAINGTYFGEDLLFSKRLRAMGFKIHVNTGAILPHHKKFWLDNRHHQPMRDFAIKKSQG
jgi:GT2 family glycosyltransferase